MDVAVRSRSGDWQLLERYHRERAPEDREALVLRYLPLARHLARRYRHGSEGDDLQQVASIGLLKAIDRFDPSRGLAFTSFALPTIVGEIKRYFRDCGWTVRVPRSLQELSARADAAAEELTRALGRAPTAEELADRCETTVELILEARGTATAHRPVSLDVPVGDGVDTDTLGGLQGVEEPGFARAELAADLTRLLLYLPEREREVIRLRFAEDLTQREIGERLGISQMHVSRLISESIATLQRIAAGDRCQTPASRRRLSSAM